jgi:hypothetical protein
MATSGGEIDVLDPAAYGMVTITKSISIQGGGFGYINVATGANGITVNAGPADVVVLNGLVIDGENVGSNGIVFNSGASLVVADCLVLNFVITGPATGGGILMQPTSGTLKFAITNTMLSNTTFGISYEPAGGSPDASGIVEHVTAINANVGGSGIALITENTSGGHLVAAISESIANYNGAGVFIANNGSPSTILVTIDNVTASGNFEGIAAFGTPAVFLGRSVISYSVDGVINNTSPNTFYTLNNNVFVGNDTNVDGPLNPAPPLQ